MNMNGTYCSAPVVERVKCNERNYTNFKLAEYAVKNYSWFFIDDKYETRRFNDSFNSIIYSGKRYTEINTEIMDKYLYVLSEVVYNILISNGKNGLDELIKYRCELLDTAMTVIKNKYPFYKDEFISMSYNRNQLFKMTELVKNFDTVQDINDGEYDQTQANRALILDVAMYCPFIYIKINNIFEYTEYIYDNMRLDRKEAVERS